MREENCERKLSFRSDAFGSSYEAGSELGRGQFAVVRRCTHKDTGHEYAAKCVRKKRTRASKQGLSRELIAREASILLELDHENIIKLIEVFETKDEVTLVLELMLGGELFEEISEHEYLTEDDACFYTKQVLDAVAHLHEKDIVHLDIKPENIVLKEKGSKTIKLVDFGLAQRLIKGQELKEMMGTPEFVAPEVINYDAIGPFTDMWAIGVMTYILLSGASPFLGDDMQETYHNIIAVDYEFDEEYFDSTSPEAIDFIRSLLIKKPSARNTVQDCLNHPWILPQTHHNSLIKTTGFKAFLARRRWQQSLRKVSVVSRFRILGRNRASVDLTASEELEKEIPNPSSPVDNLYEEDEDNVFEEKQRTSSVIDWLNLQKATATDQYRGRTSSKDVCEICDSTGKLKIPGQEDLIVTNNNIDSSKYVVDDGEEDVFEDVNSVRRQTLVASSSVNGESSDEGAHSGPIETPKVVLSTGTLVQEQTQESAQVGSMLAKTGNDLDLDTRPGQEGTGYEERKLVGKTVKCVVDSRSAAGGQQIQAKEDAFRGEMLVSPSSDLNQDSEGRETAGVTIGIKSVEIEQEKNMKPSQPLIPVSNAKTTNENMVLTSGDKITDSVDQKVYQGVSNSADERFWKDISKTSYVLFDENSNVQGPVNAMFDMNMSNNNRASLPSIVVKSSNDTRAVESSTVVVDVRKETTFGGGKAVTVLTSLVTRSAGSSPVLMNRKILRANTDVETAYNDASSRNIVRVREETGTRTLSLPRAITIKRLDMMSLVPMRFPSQPDLSPTKKTYICKLYKETPV